MNKMVETYEVRQFVKSVLGFSSQYGESSWCANNVCGPPRANHYGDNSNTWSPSAFGQEQHIEIGYDRPVYPTKFRIFESFNGGSVVKIEAIHKGDYQILYSRDGPTLIQDYNIFEVDISPKPTMRFDKYKITMSCTLAENYSQIDAIELIGTLSSADVPKDSIRDNISVLFNNKLYSDFQISFEQEVLYAHKNILAVRCADLFETLEKTNGIMGELDIKGFTVVLEFIYTDALNDEKIKQFVDNEKSLFEKKENKPVEEPNNEPKYFDEWKACVNKLVRFVMKYKLVRMEAILLNYLVEKYLTVENVLEILVDSMKDDNENVDKITAMSDVQLICFDFIRKNLTEIVGLQKINGLPKNILLKILKNIIF